MSADQSRRAGLNHAVSLLAAGLLAACASAPPPPTPEPWVDAQHRSESDSPEITARLYRIHDQWAGTPYRYGGLDRDGVDCSGLVYHSFAEHFGLHLPRTTHGQVHSGSPVSRNALRAGDLVFFRTGRKNRHVGIMLENSRFLHASTSNGVVISDLRNPYWAGNYWQARRLPIGFE